ncbi:MAG: AAA family ATPase [candidate division KSB1 bacterium]|nr:AAA family ATPase [candidate division KSB1 bacterium]MDZ7319934.1 AAA family ATPase [candidate division KSB1 bacterium]MDZ7359040.1 AAA family ATPase [candidate division KSB1 bacterium]
MSIPVLTFFNNKGGVGKTSLVYHLSWMFARLNHRVIALDLDPQANLTAAFLDEDQLEYLWENSSQPQTIYQCLKPLTEVGDLKEPILFPIDANLHLVPGDVMLAGFEEILSSVWPESMGDSNLYRPFRVLSAFWQIAQQAAQRVKAELILADVGPNLGAINRSALIASDYVVIPLGADLFSLQGLKNLGPTLRSWRSLWKKRIENWINPAFDLPAGNMCPIGYLVQQHSVKLSRPVKAYDRWVKKMPDMYRTHVLQEPESGLLPENDPYCLAMVKHYRSLVPMGQEARKPVFHLTPANGAIGSHAAAVQDAYNDFKRLAEKILVKMGETAQVKR